MLCKKLTLQLLCDLYCIKYQVKPGSLWLSKSSGRPLWLFCVKYGRHFRLNGWDNFIIPLPLTALDIEIKYLLPENNSKQGKQP